MNDHSAEFPLEHPLTPETSQAIVAEMYGLLDKENCVLLRSEACEIVLFHDPNDAIIIAEDSPDLRYTKETVISIFGTGASAELTVREKYTSNDPTETYVPVDPITEDELAASLGLGRQPLTEEQGAWVLKLLRDATEIGRSEA